jgi:thiol-disulfide isomerase/thioredoxin
MKIHLKRSRMLSTLSLLLALPAGVGSVEKLDTLSGLSVLIEVYGYNPANFQLKKIARTSILETMEIYKPESQNWFVRAFKNPAAAFSQPEFRALVDWSKKEEVPGLVLDDHSEIGDEDVARLQALQKLTLLSLRKTGITDKAMMTLNHLKNLRYLDISGTNVTPRGLAALKSLKLERLSYDDTKITPADFEKFSAGKKVAVLSSEWSSVWDETRNPAPLAEPLSYFAGSTPDEGIPGYLPKGKFKADYGLQLKTLEGRSISLASLKGRVIFLNFWSTGCGPCRSELPGLESLYQIMKDKDKKFFLGYVSPQPAALVQSAIEQQPRKLPVYTADEAALERYIGEGLPATIIISKSGEWVVHRKGPERWDAPPIVSFLNKLINAPDK